MDMLVPGTTVAGRYRLERVLGAGGMGTVFEATHVQLAQKVAVKLLLPELCSKPDSVSRFLREARAAAKIESEHIARVMDVGTTESGVTYMVMEYLEGADLASTLQQQGRLPIGTAVGYLLQAADAIAEAHSLGIIHRDLKPSNLFLATRRDGTLLLKVLDFGISKAASELIIGGAATRTATATVMGSPLYMSPEQVRSSKNVDPRSDVWSLGVILHELLAGEPPFLAETLPGVLASIVADPPVSVRAVRADVPAGIEAAILRCLQKDRTLRFDSVADLAFTLGPFAPADSRAVLSRISIFNGQRSSLTTSLREAAPSGAPARVPVAPLVPRPKRGWAEDSPARQRALGFAFAGGLTLLSVVFAFTGSRASAPSPPAPAAAASQSTALDAAHTAPSAKGSPIAGVTPLTAARWQELEQRIAGAPPAPALASAKFADPRLLGDRK